MTTSDERAEEIDREIVEPLQRARVGLDDLGAARLAAGIEAALDRAAAAPAPGGQRRAVRVAGLVLGIGAAAAVAVVAVRHAGRPAVIATPAPAPGSTSTVAAGPRAPALLAPYVYSGAGADAQTLDATGRLVVPAGARVRAAIGTRVRLTLVGPGAVSVVDPAPADGGIELLVERGRLFVDYDGRGGGILRVRSPGAVTTVVGTLFSVEALDEGTRVAVARGRVRTEAVGTMHTIVAGTAWSATAGALDPIPADVAEALADHDASPPPPVGEYGIMRIDPGPSAAGAPALDGRALAGLPIVARVPAGSHVLDGAGGRLRLDVGGGSTVRVDRASELWSARAPAPRRTALADDGTRSAEDAYLAAEAAMRDGTREQARRALEAVVARDPGGAHGEAALLDLARLALEGGDAARARRHLARLPDPVRDRGLAEAAHHLRCRVEVTLGDDPAAAACLLAFRHRYPRSSHDAEALAVLASVTRACAAARPLLEEYLRAYPRGPFAADARQRLDGCASRSAP